MALHEKEKRRLKEDYMMATTEKCTPVGSSGIASSHVGLLVLLYGETGEQNPLNKLPTPQKTK